MADTDLDVIVVRGRRPGQTLVVTAAIHGDEYEGVRAVLDACDGLDPSEMSGDLLAVPVANPPAFWSGTRTSPIDGANLARLFPGDHAGTASEVLAHHLGRSIIRRADLYLDLHSAGVRWSTPTLVGYNAGDHRSRDAAMVFGAGILWGHPTIAPGRTVSYAGECGIPWLYTEARGGGRIDAGDLAVYMNGISNLLRHLRIVPGEPEHGSIEHHLYGDGDLDKGVVAGARGFFVPGVELLRCVRAGDELGRLRSLSGALLETYHAPCDGIVVLRRELPVVEPGELVFFLTGTLPAES